MKNNINKIFSIEDMHIKADDRVIKSLTEHLIYALDKESQYIGQYLSEFKYYYEDLSLIDKLIVNNISDSESDKNNSREDLKLYLGEISNKEKIFSVLDNISKDINKKKSEEDIIVLRNIHKTYLIGIEGVPALRGVSLNVKKGEFLTIFGTSGGGKTTMLNIIGTIDTPSRGDVKIFEKLIKSDTPDKELSDIRLNNLSFVFQSFNLFQNLNVLENIEMPMKIKGKLSYKKIHERALNLIEKVGLTNRINHFPNQLSGGEQQRVTIARALVNSPNILLLDEPTGDLDTKNADIIMSLLLELNLLHGITMIMVTHDVDEAIYMSDQVVVMSSRPSKVEEVIDIDLPRPRARAQDTFQEYRTRILDVLNLGGQINEVEYYL